MSVAGEVVTYTLDYARGGRVLLEEGGAFSDTKHYLYGLECIAELVDADEPESEWRYYHQDGNHLVRQTTNIQATVTLAWTYSPEGAIVLGEEGPVTHLGCEGNTTYDFSTGLIFKNGRYFDPNTGIWITLSGIVVWNGWQSAPTNGRQRKRNRKWLLLPLLFLIVLVLAGCGSTPSPTPGATPCPEPPIPGQPSNTPSALTNAPGIPTHTPGAPNTPTPIPTSLPPTGTPTRIYEDNLLIASLIQVAKGDLQINQSLPSDSIMENTIRLLLTHSNTFGLSIDETAYVLASVAHESHMGNPMFMEEFADGWAYDPSVDPAKAVQLGNTVNGDGPRYKGRGLIQLTGRRNYEYYGIADRPEILLTDYNLGAYIAVDGMKNGVFTGTSFSSGTVTVAGTLNFYNARMIVNGIVPDVAQHIADQASKYAAALRS
jgi:hypothetical protein